MIKAGGLLNSLLFTYGGSECCRTGEYWKGSLNKCGDSFPLQNVVCYTVLLFEIFCFVFIVASFISPVTQCKARLVLLDN